MPHPLQFFKGEPLLKKHYVDSQAIADHLGWDHQNVVRELRHARVGSNDSAAYEHENRVWISRAIAKVIFAAHLKDRPLPKHQPPLP